MVCCRFLSHFIRTPSSKGKSGRESNVKKTLTTYFIPLVLIMVKIPPVIVSLGQVRYSLRHQQETFSSPPVSNDAGGSSRKLQEQALVLCLSSPPVAQLVEREA